MTPELQVLPSADLAALASARQFVALGQAAIRERGRFLVALSGGSTPERMYRLLAADPLAAALDWSRVEVLWSDERCVPPDLPESNYRMARESLLDWVAVAPARVHRIRGELAPADAALAYEREVRGLLGAADGPAQGNAGARLDLVLLGVGMEGHTASLFPGGGWLDDAHSWVRAEPVPVAPRWRVTLTPVIINAAARISFLAWGSAKADIVRRVLEGPRWPTELPAQLIAPVEGQATWFLDAAAAAGLRGGASR